MYFDGVIQLLGECPGYLRPAPDTLPTSGYVESPRAMLGEQGKVLFDRALWQASPGLHRELTHILYWMAAQHWQCLKSKVPRRFLLAITQTDEPLHGQDQYLDMVSEKLLMPLTGRTFLSHQALGEVELKPFSVYRFNDRHVSHIRCSPEAPVLHLVSLWAPASVAYLKGGLSLAVEAPPSGRETQLPSSLLFDPASPGQVGMPP